MALPSGYKRLQYIESDGNQWCNIGTIGQSGISIDAKITWLAGRIFIGSTTADDQTRCFPTFKYGNGNYFGYGYVTTYQASKAVVYGTTYTIETDFTVGAQSMKVNGEVIKTTANTTSFNNGFPLYVFAANFGGSASDKGSFRCEYCKVRLNGTLVNDLIPCENASGVAGLWDNANSVFLASEGSKPFIAGPAADPLAPYDGHNSYIGGVARDMETGTTLIGGVGREIKSGLALVGGVSREVSFSVGPHEVSVEWYPGGESSYSSIYWPVTVAGTSLTVGDSMTVDEGTSVTCGAATPNSNYADARVFMNGTRVAGGTGLNKTYSYSFEVTGPVTIQLKTNKSGGNFTGGWTYITME